MMSSETMTDNVKNFALLGKTIARNESYFDRHYDDKLHDEFEKLEMRLSSDSKIQASTYIAASANFLVLQSWRLTMK